MVFYRFWLTLLEFNVSEMPLIVLTYISVGAILVFCSILNRLSKYFT